MLNKIIESKEREKFQNATIKGVSELAPREGYYVIKRISPRRVGSVGEIAIGHVNWKTTLEEDFIEDVLHEVALRGFRSPNPNDSRPFDFQSLIGRQLYIHDVRIMKELVNGKIQEQVNCKCTILSGNPKFTNKQNLVSELLKKGTLNYDASEELAASLEHESTKSNDIYYGNDSDDDDPQSEKVEA